MKAFFTFPPDIYLLISLTLLFHSIALFPLLNFYHMESSSYVLLSHFLTLFFFSRIARPYIRTHILSCILTHTHTHSYIQILTFSYTHTHTYSQSHCRLCAARDMSLSMSSGAETDPRSNGEDETVGEMDVVLESTPSGEVISSTQRHKNSSSKPPYQAFLGQLYALIEGAIDSNRLVCTHVNSFTPSLLPPPPPLLSFF